MWVTVVFSVSIKIKVIGGVFYRISTSYYRYCISEVVEYKIAMVIQHTVINSNYTVIKQVLLIHLEDICGTMITGRNW